MPIMKWVAKICVNPTVFFLGGQTLLMLRSKYGQTSSPVEVGNLFKPLFTSGFAVSWFADFWTINSSCCFFNVLRKFQQTPGTYPNGTPKYKHGRFSFMNRWFFGSGVCSRGPVGISLEMWFFYGFYHGRSPFFNTIWENILIYFQPPGKPSVPFF